MKPRDAQPAIRQLKEIDFELAYLVMLTGYGLKPLSRWEKPLDDDAFTLLGELDIASKRISRTVQTGDRVFETVFSRTPGYVEVYQKQFADKPVDKSAQTIRFEGFLFGFPPCCVDAFVRHPYVHNDLAAEDQKILFHWACPNCMITPLLLELDSARLRGGDYPTSLNSGILETSAFSMMIFSRS